MVAAASDRDLDAGQRPPFPHVVQGNVLNAFPHGFPELAGNDVLRHRPHQQEIVCPLVRFDFQQDVSVVAWR